MYSNNFDTSNKYIKYRILTIETASDPQNNRTKIRVTVEAWRTNTGYETYGAGTCYVNINGVAYSAKITASQKLTYNSYTVLFTWEDWIYHNPDGSKTVYIAAYISHDVFSSNSQGYNVELTKHNRKATITAAPNFTDEDNPTINYSNPAGNAVDSIKACIANSTGTIVYAEYRDIPKTGTSYTFNLTDEERNAFRWGSINSPNLAVKFYVTTVIGGVTYYSTLDKIMTIANADPEVTAVIEDRGGTSRALTGSPDKIIKGFNYVVATITATPLKGASIKEIKTTNGDTVRSGIEAVFDNTESAVFDISVTDSRGKTTPLKITKQLIEYIKLTCNLEAKNPTPAGTTTLKINGNYFNGSFGAAANTLAVQFRYKENDGTYSEWLDADYTLNGNSYSATVELSGLDYRKAYTVQARAIDKIQPVETHEKVIKSLTVYDWGENDFKFNVDVYDKDGGKLGSEMVANDYDAMLLSGKSLLESGWVTITPVANSPTAVYAAFKKHYNKIPVVLVTPSSGVIGTQVLGAAINGITNDGVNIVVTRTNATPTTIYYYVFGEVIE